jgi:alanyl-tRNA synthetase
MTERLHLQDAYLFEFEARVLSSRDHDGRPAVVLDRTAFYAESGGQPCDTGTLDDARVVEVVEEDGDVFHILDRPLPEGPVRGRVDGPRPSSRSPRLGRLPSTSAPRRPPSTSTGR